MKTGDLGRYNERGELIHAGRVDFQVKIRGQRVETTEIENTIVNYCAHTISNCLVTKFPDNDDLLVAYIISNDSQLNIDKIRNHCENYLHRYMIPSYFVILDQLPLNSNGKVDRKQLPIPTALHQTSTNVVQIADQPTSELEEKIYKLWCSTLQLFAIPCHMNLFALGGSSLSLMELFSKYQSQLAPDKQINVKDFFINPTIAEHTKLLISSKSKITTAWHPLHLIQGNFTMQYMHL